MKKCPQRAALLLAFLILAGMASPAFAAGFETLGLKQVEKMVAANKGKVVMFNFFATWCPPCREEIPSLIRIRKDIGADKLVLVGLSVDEDDEALRAYVAKTGFNYPVKKAGVDLTQAAGVSGIPHMLVFDPKGEVVGNAAGLIPEKDLRDFLTLHMESR